MAQLRGYRCVFVCPDKVSEDKRNVLRAYGAEVVVCPTSVAPADPRSYYSVSDRLAGEISGAWKPDQYANPNNPISHYEGTGPELWQQTDGRLTHFVAGVGTGGTISGVGRYLREASGGTVKIIGYTQPENTSISFIPGDVTGGTFVVHGATPKKPASWIRIPSNRPCVPLSFMPRPRGKTRVAMKTRRGDTSQPPSSAACWACSACSRFSCGPAICSSPVAPGGLNRSWAAPQGGIGVCR